MKESRIREREGKKKYDLSKSFNICGCCGACSRLCVLCGSAGLEVLHQSSPLCVMRAGEHAPGKKEALLRKIWLHHQTGSIIAIRNPFCLAAEPAVLFLANPILSKGRAREPTHTKQLLVAENGGVVFPFSISLAVTSHGSSTRKSMAQIKSSTLSG
jgi:hypothetical protein